MKKDTKDIFLQLVRFGIGLTESIEITDNVDWVQLKSMADSQGLSAVVLDGIDVLGSQSSKLQENSTQNPSNSQPAIVSQLLTLNPQLKLEWIGEVLQGEQMYKLQHEVARDMSNLFHNNAIRTYVLKGDVIAECYPKPNHRVSVDVDCFLVHDSGFTVNGSEWDAWALGNDLIRAKHFDVKTEFYKNSTFDISGVVVENHQYLVPFRGNERLAELEKVLETMIQSDKGEDRFEGTWLYRPPVMVSALFLIEHAYSHFLHEGLTWRMVLDWVLFKKKHEAEIHWGDFEALIDEYGFWKFYDVFNAIGQEAFGNDSSRILETFGTSEQVRASELANSTSKLATLKKLMLEDIWASLDVHKTVRGLKGKLALAGNTWRARWKYRYFTETNWMKALWIQAKGVMLEKNPKLNDKENH